jgi:uncharacterized protein
MRFSWDDDKDQGNQRKHGISFREAKTVFFDEQAKIIDDPDHSLDDEDRFIILGVSSHFKFLVVCHCYRDDDDEIRIISARKATQSEQSFYTGARHA